ncbi:MAG: hypothetical protein E6G14_07480 [Actinobacteria bacterium]|nr:MAG: hypothetical protein E6G14_07480 [Actinomycetota bacterium]
MATRRARVGVPEAAGEGADPRCQVRGLRSCVPLRRRHVRVRRRAGQVRGEEPADGRQVQLLAPAARDAPPLALVSQPGGSLLRHEPARDAVRRLTPTGSGRKLWPLLSPCRSSRREVMAHTLESLLAEIAAEAHDLGMDGSAQAVLGASTLLEREQALAALHGAHSETKVGHGRLVFVAGEAGIGKTALVRAFCDDVRSSSRVLSGACDALATPRPLGPFVDVSTQTGGKLAAIVDEGGRSHLLERRSRECFVTDQYDEGIAALEQAIESRRSLGDRLREGDDLCRLTPSTCSKTCRRAESSLRRI